MATPDFAISTVDVRDLATTGTTLLALASSVQITNLDDFEAATLLRQDIKKALSDLDKRCDPNIENWKRGLDSARAEKRRVSDPLSQADAIIRRVQEAWRARELEQKRREAEEAREAIRRELEAENERQRLASQQESALTSAIDRAALESELETTDDPERIQEIIAALTSGGTTLHCFSATDVNPVEQINTEAIIAALPVMPATVAKVSGSSTTIKPTFRITDPSKIQEAFIRSVVFRVIQCLKGDVGRTREKDEAMKIEITTRTGRDYFLRCIQEIVDQHGAGADLIVGGIEYYERPSVGVRK